MLRWSAWSSERLRPRDISGSWGTTTAKVDFNICMLLCSPKVSTHPIGTRKNARRNTARATTTYVKLKTNAFPLESCRTMFLYDNPYRNQIQSTRLWGICLFRSYQRRSITFVNIGLSLLGFRVQLWEVGDGDEGKSNNNPLGPIVRLMIK